MEIAHAAHRILDVFSFEFPFTLFLFFLIPGWMYHRYRAKRYSLLEMVQTAAIAAGVIVLLEGYHFWKDAGADLLLVNGSYPAFGVVIFVVAAAMLAGWVYVVTLRVPSDQAPADPVIIDGTEMTTWPRIPKAVLIGAAIWMLGCLSVLFWLRFVSGGGLIRKLYTTTRFLLLALCALALPAVAQSRFECSAMQSKLLKRPVPYCVMLPPSFDSDKTRKYPVLYYLHGLGDNEQSLVNGGGWELYEKLMRQQKIGEFLIVTPSGFRSFYVNARNGKFSYEDFFFQEFLPAIEKRYRAVGTRSTRGVMGVSMGGYGAFRYAFAHPTMFASVSAHMPALSEELPTSMSSPQEQRMLQGIFGTGEKGSPIDLAYYKRISPFTAAEQAPIADLKRLAIYYDCGANDDYGFDLGSQALHKALLRRGIAHEFHIYPGGHNWNYVMQHFGASMEFHSKILLPKSVAH